MPRFFEFCDRQIRVTFLDVGICWQLQVWKKDARWRERRNKQTKRKKMSHYLRRVRSVGLLPGTPYFALPSLSRFSIGNHSESFFFLQSFSYLFHLVVVQKTRPSSERETKGKRSKAAYPLAKIGALESPDNLFENPFHFLDMAHSIPHL